VSPIDFETLAGTGLHANKGASLSDPGLVAVGGCVRRCGERVELAFVAEVIKHAEVSPIDFETLAGTGLHANKGASLSDPGLVAVGGCVRALALGHVRLPREHRAPGRAFYWLYLGKFQSSDKQRLSSILGGREQRLSSELAASSKRAYAADGNRRAFIETAMVVVILILHQIAEFCTRWPSSHVS